MAEPGIWKTEAELKEYLKNLSIEYRYGCYEERRPQACHLLADYFLAIDKNVDQAKQTYQKNCDDDKYGLSCDAYGRLLYKDQLNDKSKVLEAFKYFEKGCELNEPRSCYHAGQMLTIKDVHINKQVKSDPERGIKMLKNACLSDRQPAACTLLHTLYLNGFHGKPKDLDLASKFGKIACHQEQYEACYNLSRMYHIGDGVIADQDMARYYRSRTKQCISKSAQRQQQTLSPM